MDSLLQLLEAWRAFVGVLGLFFTGWSILDDMSDRRNINGVNREDGPRYITATGNFYSNSNLIVAWLFYLYSSAVTIYLPTRTDTSSLLIVSVHISTSIYAVMFLFGQIHHRIARYKLGRLTRKQWIVWIRELLRQLPESAK